MRCFVAIELPPDVRGRLDGVVARLRPLSRGVRWVAADAMHLTLKFLGEVGDEKVAGLAGDLSATCAGHRPFRVVIRGTGVFPGPKHPNVLWAGAECPEELRSLHRNIDEALAGQGFPRETRTFSPHLTLGRVRDRKDIDLVVKELATFGETVFGTIDVAQIVLMKSTLKPTGAEYALIARCGIGQGRGGGGSKEEL